MQLADGGSERAPFFASAWPPPDSGWAPTAQGGSCIIGMVNPPQGNPATDDRPKIRPSMAYLGLAAPFFIAGFAVFAYTLIGGLLHFTDSLTQVAVPGSQDFVFQKGLIYTVYLEEEAVVDGKIYSTKGPLEGLSCKVTSTGRGTEIGLSRARETMSYNLGRRSGRSVLEFAIPENGRYQFVCQYPEGSTGPRSVLAIGTGLRGKLVSMILVCIGSMFGGTAGAAMVVLVVLGLRARHKKRIAG